MYTIILVCCPLPIFSRAFLWPASGILLLNHWRLSISSGKHGIDLPCFPLVNKSSCTGNWAPLQHSLICWASLIIGETFIDQSHAKFCCHQSVHQPVGWLNLLIQIFFFFFLPSFRFLSLRTWKRSEASFLSHTAGWEIYLVLVRKVDLKASAAGCRKAGSWNGEWESAEGPVWLQPEKVEHGAGSTYRPFAPSKLCPHGMHTLSGFV